MRRSLLFIPANNPGMLQNATLFSADSVIFDLEDAVSLSDKDSARILLKNFLEKFSFDIEVVVRINGLDTNLFMDDLNEIITEKINTVMVPKARISDLIKLDLILENIEQSKKIYKKIKIIPIIELASSLLEVEEIAKLDRVDGVLLGAEDLASDLEIERTSSGEELLYPRSKIAYACRALKKDAIDTPFTDTLSDEGLTIDSLTAKRLGLNAKAAIHPNQVRFINQVFSPSPKQIEHALRVIKAETESSKGAFSLDGKMIDKPIIERSKKVIEKAKKYDLI